MNPVAEAVRAASSHQCEVDGCTKPARSSKKLVCEMHYYRMRRTGSYDLAERTPLPPGSKIDRAPRVRERWHRLIKVRVIPLCQVEHCTEPRKSHGYCGTHWERVRKYGDPAVVKRANWTGDHATYNAVHQRLILMFGRASTHSCACGSPARQWAYQHTDPDEKRHPSGYPYSTDVHHYKPMCVSCHKTLDLGRK